MSRNERRSSGSGDPQDARRRLRGLTAWMWINVAAVLLILAVILIVIAVQSR